MSLAHDKKLHIAAGLAIAVASYMLSGQGLALEPLLALLHIERGTFAALATLVIGVAKECYDHFHPNHTVDPMDAAATFFPGLLVYIGDWAYFSVT